MCGVFSSLLVCLRLISFLCLGVFGFAVCLFVFYLSAVLFLYTVPQWTAMTYSLYPYV